MMQSASTSGSSSTLRHGRTLREVAQVTLASFGRSRPAAASARMSHAPRRPTQLRRSKECESAPAENARQYPKALTHKHSAHCRAGLMLHDSVLQPGYRTQKRPPMSAVVSSHRWIRSLCYNVARPRRLLRQRRRTMKSLVRALLRRAAHRRCTWPPTRAPEAPIQQDSRYRQRRPLRI